MRVMVELSGDPVEVTDSLLSPLVAAGLRVDTDPIPLSPRIDLDDVLSPEERAALSGRHESTAGALSVVAGELENGLSIGEFTEKARSSLGDSFVEAYEDPEIDVLVPRLPVALGRALRSRGHAADHAEPFSWAVNHDPKANTGAIEGAFDLIGAGGLRAWGGDGATVTIGICDSGVYRRHVAIADGWTPDPKVPPGVDISIVPHGTMVAWNAKQIAPSAEIWDIGLLKSKKVTAQNGSDGIARPTLFGAMEGFEWAIGKHVEQRERDPNRSLVLCNSWGLRGREGALSSYASDPDNPFTRKVLEATQAGIHVVFAAGNCGSGCPDARCLGCGPGQSIWGANGHPAVITVGATDLNDNWMGYSSEGPSGLQVIAPPGAERPLTAFKPDVCAPSQFEGYLKRVLLFDFPDGGTSTSAPVLVGGIAALLDAVAKNQNRTVTPLQLRNAVRSTARLPGTTQTNSGFISGRFGFGIADLLAAYEAL